MKKRMAYLREVCTIHVYFGQRISIWRQWNQATLKDSNRQKKKKNNGKDVECLSSKKKKHTNTHIHIKIHEILIEIDALQSNTHLSTNCIDANGSLLAECTLKMEDKQTENVTDLTPSIQCSMTGFESVFVRFMSSFACLSWAWKMFGFFFFVFQLKWNGI